MSFGSHVETLREKVKNWDFKELKKLFQDKTEEVKDNFTFSVKSNSDNHNYLKELHRTKENITTEIEFMQTKYDKTNCKCNFIKTNTFNSARKVFEAEQLISKLDILQTELTDEKNKLDEEIRILASPTRDSVFSEFMRGMGIDLITNKDGSISARVINKEKQDVHYVDINNDLMCEIGQQIWKLV